MAIKVLRDPLDEPEHMERLREFVFYNHVPSHPNLTNILEMFVDCETLQPAFVMELGDVNLLQPLDWHRQYSRLPLGCYDIAGIIRSILLGLSHIHEHGFVHRDIKPENILLSFAENGVSSVKIADFGLSRRMEESKTDWTTYVATRWYRAPEQLLMIRHHTPALDVWAATLLLCELCNLRPLFPGTTKLDMVQHQVAMLGFPRNSVHDPVTQQMVDQLGVLGVAEAESQASAIVPDHPMFELLVRSGLSWNPQLRPSARTLARHLDHIMHRLHMHSYPDEDIATAGTHPRICISPADPR